MSFLKIKDPVKRDAIVRDFLKAKANIYAQSQQEKFADIDSEREATKYFKPIIQSQQQLSEDITGTQEKFLREITEAVEPLPQQLALPADSGSKYTYGAVASESFLKALEKEQDHDTTFGLYTRDNKHYIGSKVVEIEDDDLIIGDKKYKGTSGLWELIRSKNPTHYTENDLDAYKKIMLQTNALYQENNPALPVKSSRSVKYKSIIKPIYDSTKTKRKSTKKILKGSGTVFSHKILMF